MDRFVVVEANRTFTGQDKPLHVRTALGGQLAPYADKIHHVVAELPEFADSPWQREITQRDALYDALRTSAPPSAIVTVCDVDEIPHIRALVGAAESYEGPRFLAMRHAVLFANWRLPRLWRRAFLATPEDLKAAAARLNDGDWPPDAPALGWHLSFLGGRNMIRSKLAAYSHQELNTDRATRESFLRQCVVVGITPTTRQLLIADSPADAGELIAQLSTTQPDYLGPVNFPPALRRRAFRAWATLRTRRWIPERLVAWVDAHPPLAYWLGYVCLFPVEILQSPSDGNEARLALDAER